MDSETLLFYRRGQRTDAVMACLTTLLSLAYLLLFPGLSDRSALIASIVALAGMLGACLKQFFERPKLRQGGLI